MLYALPDPMQLISVGICLDLFCNFEITHICSPLVYASVVILAQNVSWLGDSSGFGLVISIASSVGKLCFAHPPTPG